MASLFDYLTPERLSALLNVGGNLALTEQGVNAAQGAGESAFNYLTQLGRDVQTGSTFKPYTITTGVGNYGATSSGVNATLDPRLQAISEQLIGQGRGLFGIASQDVGQRANDVTAMLEAAAAPSRERDYLALENRLFNQGRLGLSTAATGGSPEMFAFAKALEEQRSQNALTGRQQALAEQMQGAQVGSALFNAGFTPFQQLLQGVQTATPFAELSTRSALQGLTTGAELAAKGSEAKLQGEQLATLLRQQQLQGLLNSLTVPASGSTSSTASGLFADLFKSLGITK